MNALDLAFLAALFGLYLLDCVVLVQRGQGVLERRAGHWRLALGSRHYLLKGRPIVVLNPLTPWAPTFKTQPILAPSAASIKPLTVVRALGSTRLLTAFQIALVLAILPIVIFRLPGWPVIVALLLAYVNVLIMLWRLFAAFRKAGLARAPLYSLAFGCVVCLPLSVNMLRRACLGIPLLADTARCLRLLPRSARSGARSALLAQLDEAIQDADEGTPRCDALKVLQRDLSK